MSKGFQETYSNLAFKGQIPFSTCIQSEKCEQNLKKLLEVFKIEQFVKCLLIQLKQWLLDKKPTNLTEVARWADEYNVLHNSGI